MAARYAVSRPPLGPGQKEFSIATEGSSFCPPSTCASTRPTISARLTATNARFRQNRAPAESRTAATHSRTRTTRSFERETPSTGSAPSRCISPEKDPFVSPSGRNVRAPLAACAMQPFSRNPASITFSLRRTKLAFVWQAGQSRSPTIVSPRAPSSTVSTILSSIASLLLGAICQGWSPRYDISQTILSTRRWETGIRLDRWTDGVAGVSRAEPRPTLTHLPRRLVTFQNSCQRKLEHFSRAPIHGVARPADSETARNSICISR